MNYVKPYLKNIQRLQMDEQKASSPDLVGAFEGSVIEVEIMGQFLPLENKKYWSVMNSHFLFRTKPSLNYHAEGYQRGPIHEGYVEITHRTYTWTQEQIDNYRKMRDKEDFLLLRIIDKNLDFAMSELGDEFFRYLEEAEKMMGDKYGDEEYVPFSDIMGIKKKNESKDSENKKEKSANPFASLVGGFKELGSAFSGNKPESSKKPEKKEKENPVQKKTEQGNAESDSSNKSWLVYKNYKKAHKMIAW